MIIVVEGPSAAGKTTWCRSHYPDQTVWEAPVTAAAPDRQLDPDGAEKYWAGENSKRWTRALEMESSHSLAVCDTDPFKLHYAWCLFRLGLIAEERWLHAVDVHRRLFAGRAIGIADLILVSFPDAERLRRQKVADPTRTRRSFNLHLSLVPPLKEWYGAVSALGPDRVHWSLPDTGIDSELSQLGSRPVRTGVALFDELFRVLTTSRHGQVTGSTLPS